MVKNGICLALWCISAVADMSYGYLVRYQHAKKKKINFVLTSIIYLNYTYVFSFLADYNHIFLLSTFIVIFCIYRFSPLFFYFFTFNRRHALWLNARTVGLKRRKTFRRRTKRIIITRRRGSAGGRGSEHGEI